MAGTGGRAGLWARCQGGSLLSDSGVSPLLLFAWGFGGLSQLGPDRHLGSQPGSGWVRAGVRELHRGPWRRVRRGVDVAAATLALACSTMESWDEGTASPTCPPEAGS